jgi:AcrR family transcriptional regulator
MDERQRARPGGRSARVRAAVHQAVTDLISERGYGAFTVGDVAARAGVADSSIYRRWGSLENLLSDVVLTRLNTRSPMPDTGSLAGDLRAYAANVAREITGPDGLALLRLAVRATVSRACERLTTFSPNATGNWSPCSIAPANAASTPPMRWACWTT